MVQTLTNLPQIKENEIDKIVSIIRKNVEVEMIILFGSHARGDWVSDRYQDRHITYEYESDYDLLLVVKNEKDAKNYGQWNKLEELIRNDPEIKTPVSILVDSIRFINKKIEEGSYFYVDIKKEGIVLYDSKKFTLTQTKNLDPKTRAALIQRDCEFWFGKAQSFLKDFVHNINDGELNNAAFHLHQVTEALLVAVLLAGSGYKPKTHNIEKILNLAGTVDKRLKEIFPRTDDFSKKAFDLLRRAYIDARYTKEYKITLKQLEHLLKEVQALEKLTKQVCEEKIKSIPQS